MEKKMLDENQREIINGVKDKNFKKQLIERFMNGEFMTSEEFCQKLEDLKASLIKKHKMRTDKTNSL